MIKKAIGYAIGQSTHSDGTLINGVSSEEALSWLEKQGEQKHETPIPRFNIGDWVIVHNKDAYQVIGLNTYDYRLQYYLGGKMNYPFKYESDLKPWTIQDAKAGDVLACKGNIKYSNGIKYERICLFNNIDNAFFTLTKNSNSVEEYDIDVNIDYPDNTVPATKEQKEILFMVMKEAGYKWDAEKKELKEIEQKSVFEMKTPEESLGIDSNTYNKIVDECIYGEQKPADVEEISFFDDFRKTDFEVEPKFKVGDIVQCITDSTDRRRIEEVDELCNMYHTDSLPIMFEVEDEWKIIVLTEDVEQEQSVDFPQFTFDDVIALQRAMENMKKVQEDKDLYDELLLLHNKVYDAYTITKKHKLL